MSVKMIYIDTESSGLNPEKNALIQLSGIIVIDGEEKEEFNFFVRPFPGDELLEESLAIGGFTKHQVLTNPRFEDPGIVHKKFTSILSRYVDRYNKYQKFTMCAYNARFDMDFLRAWFIKNGDKFIGSFLWFPPIDALNSAAERLVGEREMLPNFKLMTVAKHLGIEVDDERLHDSLYDIRITKKVMEKVKEMDRKQAEAK